ncbi:MAG: hypothetical protein KDJ35_01490 [Alphaproteobacteria bacterium]|nr:hypothetical protein [Alphaproteobacteria bacterium]
MKNLKTYALGLMATFGSVAFAQSQSNDNSNLLAVNDTRTEIVTDKDNKNKDPDAVKEADYSTAKRFSNIAQVEGRDEQGMFVIQVVGPESMRDQIIQAAWDLHGIYEDPNRDFNAETAVRYRFNNDLNKIAVHFLMDGDDFKLKSGTEYFTVQNAKDYADTFLKQYALKAGQKVPATPKTPSDAAAVTPAVALNK